MRNSRARRPPIDAQLGKIAFRTSLALALALSIVFVDPGTSHGQVPSLPDVGRPFAGDPRLEPIPDGPIHLVNFDVFADGKVVTMRFPPRVNGQTQSNGDGHADLYVLFDASTGLRIAQPPILEAVPKNAAGPGVEVDDLTARLFSPIWEMHAVTVDSSYNPADPAMRIDSEAKLLASPLVRTNVQTNIFLNCPVVPVGSTIDPGSAPIEEALWDGHVVNIVPYDIEDGPFNPQILFKFEDSTGNVLGAPHLVASRAPGRPFYSSIWEVWTVHVPDGFDVTTIRSAADVKSSGFPISSSGIRLDCPAVAVDGVPIPPEDAFAMLLNDNGRFNPDKPFQFDVPETAFTKPRTFVITENGPVIPAVPPTGTFPPVDPDGKGNVIPLILTDPFAVNSSGPNTTGDIVRIDQAELDAARANNTPPLLPAAIEANFTRLIQAGLLSPDWGPCGRSYQDRLAVVGRALFELVWKPEQGANQKDVTRCLACHSQPAAGGAARGLYTRELPGGIRINAGSLWGSGGAEELVKEKKARGESVTFAHGSLGHLASIRQTLNNVSNTFFGIQSIEFVRAQASAVASCDTDGDGTVSLAEAMTCDLDGDGVANELSVGEVTAETTFFMSLPAPDQAPDVLLPLLGVTRDSVEQGKRLFRRSIDDGGAACASCHTPFHPLEHTEFVLSNPQTNVGLPIRVSHHVADADDVAEGLASFVGQAGLRTYGDFKLHKMGARLFSNNTDRAKTAEVWDAGSVFPYARDGSFGSNLRAVIEAHEGVPLDAVTVDIAPQVDQPSGGSTVSSQTVTLTNTSAQAIDASAAAPIRVVLSGAITAGVHALNADGSGPAGSSRQGSFWLVTAPIPAGGTVTLELRFDNPDALPLAYDLVVEDHPGYSEAVAATRAFEALDPPLQDEIVAFLRAQLIGAKLGEGSGGVAADALCGNGVLDPGEECDDGNVVSGDCCSSVCHLEQAGCFCDDHNVCTDTSTCDGGGMCQGTGFNTDPCQDGNACTAADSCAAGTCVAGPPLDCDDHNLCTDDSCDPASGCVHTPKSPGCDDGDPCTDDSCDPATGECQHTPNTAPCDDGNACTTGDRCSAGSCQGGPALACDDGNVCTTDSCDPAHGCVHAPNTLSCDDGNACTIGDVCSGGRCTGGTARSCDDGNVCTTDSCDPATGCVHTPNTASCDDGNVCTTADTCSGGTCVGGPPLVCPTGPPVAVVEADTFVSSDKPAVNFGAGRLLNADAGPTVQRTFLRVRVVGVGPRQVTGAHLRLQVAKVTNAQSVTGGRIHPITDCGWNERTMTWNTQPAIDGPVLATAGSAAQGRVIDFDVSAAIHGDGVYCFALDTPSTDSVIYNSREAAAGKPEVAVTAVCPCAPGPASTTTITTPTTSTTTTTTLPAATAVGAVVADTYVQSDLPTTNFGTKTVLSVDNGVASAPGTTGVQRTFLRISVSGVGTRRVSSARLQLQVAKVTNAQSVSGGRIHAITGCNWDERTLTWKTQPAIDGPVLATIGAVAQGQTVNFDVTAAIPGDGLYCFAIDTTSTDSVIYNSREGSLPRPTVVIQVAQ